MMVLGVVGGMMIAGLGSAQTHVPAGNVYGTWNYTGSPYLIEGEILVPDGYTLMIQPGVEANFQGHYKLTVEGILLAIGTEEDSILFTAENQSDGWGGIRLTNTIYQSSSLKYCIFEHGRASGPNMDSYGGAIFCGSASQATIKNCRISNNSADNCGGGIYSDNASPTIDKCLIISNQAPFGEGIWCHGGLAIISNCEFQWNGLDLWGNSTNPITIENCLINSTVDAEGYVNLFDCTMDDGVLYFSGYDLEIENCIIRTGIQVSSGNLICSYSNIQGGWPGVGNIDEDPLFVSGPDGNYYLSQIEAGQSQQSPCVDAGDPASILIEGTTRTDGAADTGVVDMGYHYPLFLPPPPVEISLDPLYTPIYISPWGGDFGYYIRLNNNTEEAQTFDLWIDILMPDSSLYGPVLLREDLTLPAYSHTSRLLIQEVPAAAPEGRYINTGHIGDHVVQEIWDEDAFAFTKVGYDAGGNSKVITDWRISGWFDPSIDITEAEPVPTTFSLSSHPNPFNPTTVLIFKLQVASWVELEIFDVNGCAVGAQHAVPLQKRWYSPGAHQITFDGSNLPSGIYFARLQAGDYTAVRKMVLVK